MGSAICKMEREFHDLHEIQLFNQFEGSGERFLKLCYLIALPNLPNSMEYGY